MVGAIHITNSVNRWGFQTRWKCLKAMIIGSPRGKVLLMSHPSSLGVPFFFFLPFPVFGTSAHTTSLKHSQEPYCTDDQKLSTKKHLVVLTVNKHLGVVFNTQKWSCVESLFLIFDIIFFHRIINREIQKHIISRLQWNYVIIYLIRDRGPLEYNHRNKNLLRSHCTNRGQ